MSIFDKILDKNTAKIQEIAVNQIVPNTYQPRQEFDSQQIAELAQSIHTNGLLQPIVVRPSAEQKYELIAGERRFRAVSSLKWTKIPAIVRNYDDEQSAALALIENLQRQDLNPIEEAQAYSNLAQLNGFKQQDLAKSLGKSQSYVANKIRLLKLDPQVQTAIGQGLISQRHGRALLALDMKQQQESLQEIIKANLNVVQTEQLVKKLLQPAKTKEHNKIRALKSTNTKLAINTIRDSVKLAQKNGAQFTYDEINNDTEYQMIITVKKERKNG
ncbi:nucleoid occlusion protein [Bombilactobacillus thymidiniphilus]|uniref:Nucleoid occlusion protein n=1 Tax=Bombilactobacillus thymidiniphilus TaxID=2923363 RepID=A0ABY4PBM8_9LACO|nr:nucleoid occlusion protein [Bombilactobacillus thymidiniphilus]UQS83020.1 nucleoid occlusion protein [Bombilactobacillus thymidiniphilus]